MTGKSSMMNAIKRAVSPKSQRSHPGTDMIPIEVQETPLTTYICSRLRGDNLRLFALMFAEAIKNDRHAKLVPFENVYTFLGYDYYHHAVRQLKKLFPETKSTSSDNHTTSGEVAKNKPGPSKDSYLISVRQFETMMLAAKTDEGARAREMMLDVKDAVQDYMKMEMEASARAANERLAVEEARRVESDARRLELETAQAGLQATLNAEKERRSAMKALRDAEDEPRQTAYLMESGVHRSYVKIGKTGEEGGEKRKKELQTGNPEEITVLFEIKCVDSKLVERNLHHVFRWYKRRGEWYEIDKERAIYVTRMMVNILDGLRRVEHDEEDIVEACQRVLNGHALQPPALVEADKEESEDDEWKLFRDLHLVKRNGKCGWSDLLCLFKEWHTSEYGCAPETKEKVIKQYFEKHLKVACKNNRVDNNKPLLSFKGWTLIVPEE